MNDDLKDLLDNEDDGIEVNLVQSRPGRMVSLKGLVERVIEQFNNEFAHDTPAFLEADTPAKKRGLVRDVAEYIFSVESVMLSPHEKADILQTVYSETCGFGGLDALFADERVTTILVEGKDALSARYAPAGDIVPLVPIFDDMRHLRRIMTRLLAHGSAEMRPDMPIMEVGLRVNHRPVCVNIVFPPYASELTADIRVHALEVPTLSDWVMMGYMDEKAKAILEALVISPHGFVIVGDTESGKTTLLATLAHLLPQPQRTITVERAGECQLPAGMAQKVVQWAIGEQLGVSFAERIQEALAENPACLLVDEVRADEADAITPLLSEGELPRQIWTFRGASDSKRIRSALSILARLADKAHPESAVNVLYQRLPFVVILKRRKGNLHLIEVAEWQYPHPQADYPNYVPLLTLDWQTQATRLTGNQPMRDLALGADFWGA